MTERKRKGGTRWMDAARRVVREVARRGVRGKRAETRRTSAGLDEGKKMRASRGVCSGR